MSDHDMHHDLATELVTVADHLDMVRLPEAAAGARDAAVALMNRELSVNRAIKLLCRYENLLGDVAECV